MQCLSTLEFGYLQIIYKNLEVMCTIFKLNLSCIQYCCLVNFDLFMLKAFECYCECYNWYVS